MSDHLGGIDLVLNSAGVLGGQVSGKSDTSGDIGGKSG